jgi:DNA polymerase III sliding clamp (beta) subunit (PCNA family)
MFTGEDVLSFNDRVCIRHPIKVGFSFSVKADEFFKLLSRLKSEYVTLTKKGETIMVTTARTTAQLSCLVTNDLKEVLENLNEEIYGNKAEWRNIPKGFKKAVEHCMFSASKDEGLPIMTNLYFKDNQAFSCDNARASWFTMEETFFEPFLLKASACPDLISFPVTEYALTNSWAHFATGDEVIYSVRRMKGEYPDVTEFFIGFGTSKLKMPIELKDAIETVSIMVEDEILTYQFIEITIKNDRIECRGEQPDKRGWATQSLEFAQEIDIENPITMSVNPKFFIQVLDENADVFTGESKILFKTGDFQHILTTRE